VRWRVWDPFVTYRMMYTARFGLRYPATAAEWQSYFALKPNLAERLSEAPAELSEP
jgi:hypothetical protein